MIDSIMFLSCVSIEMAKWNQINISINLRHLKSTPLPFFTETTDLWNHEPNWFVSVKFVSLDQHSPTASPKPLVNHLCGWMK